MSGVAQRIWEEGILCTGPVISVALVCWYDVYLFFFFLKKDIRSVGSYLKQMY